MWHVNDVPQHVATDRSRSRARRRPARPKIVVIEQRMTSMNESFAHLSDDELLATVKCLATSERRATAALVRSLMELGRAATLPGRGLLLAVYVLHPGVTPRRGGRL